MWSIVWHCWTKGILLVGKVPNIPLTFEDMETACFLGTITCRDSVGLVSYCISTNITLRIKRCCSESNMCLGTSSIFIQVFMKTARPWANKSQAKSELCQLGLFSLEMKSLHNNPNLDFCCEACNHFIQVQMWHPKRPVWREIGKQAR